MSGEWRPMNSAPTDGTLVRFWCRGVGHDPKDFECYGRYVGDGRFHSWAAFEGDRNVGMVYPLGWKPAGGTGQ